MTHRSFTAVIRDDSLEEGEKKKTEQRRRWPTWRWRKGEKKKKHDRAEGAQVLVSIYGLFICSLLSGFLPPTSAEDSHWITKAHLTGGSAWAFSRDLASHIGRARRTFVSPVYPFSANLSTHLTALSPQTKKSCLPASRTISPNVPDQRWSAATLLQK